MTKERGTAGRSSNASFGSSRIGIRTDRHSSACAVAAGGRGSISASPRIRPRIYLRTLRINNHFGAGCTGAAIHAICMVGFSEDVTEKPQDLFKDFVH